MLPVAAASGWWAALYSQKRRKVDSRARLNSAYVQGLNHLLNEEPDKATEVLVRIVEVDPDTIELHLVLGSLFRRRGEVDRAIRVHENIVARSNLSEALRTQATLELGRDFLKAGLLDRAEQLFQNLLQRGEYAKDVCLHLIDLYQQEKEWGKALDIAGRLVHLDSVSWQSRIAHYHCELAETAIQQQDLERALQRLESAIQVDAACARASLLKGKVYQQQQDYRSALEAYKQVEEQEPGLLNEVIGLIEHCYEKLGAVEQGREFVNGLMARHSGLALVHDQTPELQLQQLTAGQARYRCDRCGFSSKKLFWQCPGCQQWSSVKPIQMSHSA